MTSSGSGSDAAIARSLAWAADSADRGDFEGALGWLGVVEAVNGGLDDEWLARQQEWERRRDEPRR